MPGSNGLKLFVRNGIWYIRGTIRGQSVYESTGTSNRADAEAFKALREAELWKSSVFGARAVVTFAHAVERYVQSKTLSAQDKTFITALLKHFKQKPLGEIDQAALDGAYKVLLPPGASDANKLRTVLAPLRTLLNFAARRKWCDAPHFEVPAIPPARVAFLLPDQAIIQAAHCSEGFRPLYWFLLLTGARASEATELRRQDVDLAGGRVVFRKTKNGRERHHDLAPAAIALLSVVLAGRREDAAFDHVFLAGEIRARDGRVVVPAHPYRDNDRSSGGQFKTAWAGMKKRSKITNFRPHDLRHTWATWHYCLHKDLLKLRDEGGWRTADQVEIYAHLMPDFYRPQIQAILAGAPAVPIRKEAS